RKGGLWVGARAGLERAAGSGAGGRAAVPVYSDLFRISPGQRIVQLTARAVPSFFTFAIFTRRYRLANGNACSGQREYQDAIASDQLVSWDLRNIPRYRVFSQAGVT